MESWGVHGAPWSNHLKKRVYETLREDLNVDVAIVGAGIMGLTAAIELQGKGLKVGAVTSKEVGHGATGFSTGHLTCVPDCSFNQLVSHFGMESATKHIANSKNAISQIENLCLEFKESFNRDCGFSRVSGFKFTDSENEVAALNEDDTVAKKLGLETQRCEELFIKGAKDIYEFKEQALFDPLNFVIGLAEKFLDCGGRLFENSRVLKVEDGASPKIETDLGSVSAKSIVLATHTPVGQYLSLHTRLVPMISYVMAVRLKNPPLRALYWDTSNPYFYMRPLKEDIFIIGGKDHKTGQELRTLEKFAELDQYIRDRFEVSENCFYWSGEIFEPLDDMPYVGKIPFTHEIYTGTGFSGTGLTLGSIAGKAIAAEILGQKSSDTEMYSPTRIKPMASGPSFVKQNASVAKWMIADQFSHNDSHEIKDLAVNEGRVVDLGNKKVAVYRNENGRIHVLSSKCTHLGATVHWNSAEKTWDCPCHGGRYRANGEVCEGPQLKDLEDVPLYTEENPDVIVPSGLSPVPDQCELPSY